MASCPVRLKTTKEAKILQRRGEHSHEAQPAFVQVFCILCSQVLFSSFSGWILFLRNCLLVLICILSTYFYETNPTSTQVRQLEAKKMEEILRNPETATAKDLFFSISKEILNQEMASFASSYAAITRRLQRRLKKMREGSPCWNGLYQKSKNFFSLALSLLTYFDLYKS